MGVKEEGEDDQQLNKQSTVSKGPKTTSHPNRIFKKKIGIVFLTKESLMECIRSDRPLLVWKQEFISEGMFKNTNC